MSHELAEIAANEYRNQGLDALLHAKKTLANAQAELDRHIQQYQNAATDKERSRYLNWTINLLASNILSNARLDMLANAQAELAKIQK